jgi:protein deglycase
METIPKLKTGAVHDTIPTKPILRGCHVTTSNGRPPNVLLFLGSGFEDLEAVTVLDACGWTSYRDHLTDVQVTVTGLHPEIQGRFGVILKADVPFEALVASDYDAIVLPGGFGSHGYDEVYDERIYALLRAIYEQGGIVVTMCIGILPVAEAGLVEGKCATTYPYSSHDNMEQLRQGGARTSQDLVVSDDRIISCRGPVQSLEIALLLLESLIGPDASAEVRRFMTGDDTTSTG